MFMKKKKTILAWFLALVIVCGIYNPIVEADEVVIREKEANQEYTLYRWKKAKSLEDLPQKGNDKWTPIMLFCDEGGKRYAPCDVEKMTRWMGIGGEEYEMNTVLRENVNQLPDGKPDEFYTRGTMNPWWIKWESRSIPAYFPEWYKGKANTKKTDGMLNAYKIAGSKADGSMSDQLFIYRDKCPDYAKFVAPDDKQGSYLYDWFITSKSKDSEQFTIALDVPGEDVAALAFIDTPLVHKLYANKDEVKNKSDGLFYDIYVGEKLDSTILDKTLLNENAGSMQDFEGNYFIKQGQTLTIPEDTVVMISGRLANEGTIVNKGVLIVNSGGMLSTMDSDGGSIKNEGGDVLVLNEGILFVPQNFIVKNGTFINKGVSIIPYRETNAEKAFYVKNAIVDNQGYCFSGMLLDQGTQLFK